MCGIAGYFGANNLTQSQILNCHKSMKQRGPDASGNIKFRFKKKNIYLLHNRLKIIDLSNSANQPLTYLGYTIIFNGEIYNFKEIRKNLLSKGYKFKTNSDTEVLLKNFIHKKFEAFNDFEGMWSIAIWNDNSKELILSRDRFGQKPLFYFHNGCEFYFGSQINQIFELSHFSFTFNKKKINDYLGSGYRVIFKDNETFFKKIKHFPSSHYAIIKNQKIIFKRYWKLKNSLNNKISYKDAKNKIHQLITKSVSNCLISDQKVSTMLSGGIDSNVILNCIMNKNFSKINTCSVIDQDRRYDESKLINIATKNKNFNEIKIDGYLINNYDFVEALKKRINFYSAPVLTATSYVSSFLQKRISEENIRVNLSGIGSDEIFSGYYQHHSYFLKSTKNKDEFKNNLRLWKKNIYPYLRNPFLKDEKKFIKKKNFFIKSLLNYEANPGLKKVLKNYKYLFREKKFSLNFLKNRMYNEIFYENIPTMLFEDDRNHMFYSIENRSPFLDKDLVEFAMSLPPDYLIKNGYSKYILRDCFKNKIDNRILFNKEKKGFNFNLIETVFENKNFDNIMSILEDKTNQLYEFVNFNQLNKILHKTKHLNSESKFIFSAINAAIFFKKL